MRPILLLALLAACGSERAAPATALRDTVPPAAPAALPDNVAILPDSAARAATQQCSRAAPDSVTGTWTPTAEQVARAEALLPAFLAARDPEPRDLKAVARQYAGVVSRGRRVLYLNGFPLDRRESGNPDVPWDWRRSALLVCDGGPPFFGAEFDVEAGRFTRADFNGSAG